MLKKLLNLVVILSFVVSTMSIAAHASASHEHVKKTEVSQQKVDHHNCHQADKAEASQKTTKSDHKRSTNNCCEKNCTCIGGMCGGSSSNILGASEFSLQTLSTQKNYFAPSLVVAAADRDGRLKRPPRA